MLKLYNTLTRQIEEFAPMDPDNVKIYSCGPTVYDYQHIGHMRRYVGDDILIRLLKANGYQINHVMNITDVGHLTSDSDTGEDKMEKGSRKHGLSVWEIAKKFENQFFYSIEKLNIKKAGKIMHATDYIEDQIELIKALEEKDFTYKTVDGIYFDTSRFPDYFKLSGLSEKDLRAGARIEVVPGKKNFVDFALWKFTPKGTRRQMEWESPWGIGFPGWHIECSAMSMTALGPTLDIHTGGMDHVNVHHSNEIAQSEAATNRKFVNFWVHHAFLLVEDEKMSKSIGNIYTVDDVIKKGFNPLALRYLYFQTHYRHEMNFTWKALEAAQTALDRLYEIASGLGDPQIGCAQFEQDFLVAAENDLDMPKAISIVWEMLRSDYPARARAETLYKMDEILGLEIRETAQNLKNIPSNILDLVREREDLRKAKKFIRADHLRAKIEKMGYEIKDGKKGAEIKRKISF